MLSRIRMIWVPALLSLVLVACGSKGELVLPKAPVPQPAAPAPPVPAKQP